MFKQIQLLFCVLICMNLHAQDGLFSEAKSLYDKGKYSASQSILNQLINSSDYNAEILFLNASCSKELFADDALELYKKLNDLFPFNNFKDQSNIDIAHIYYREKVYSKAAESFLKLKYLTNEMEFKLAYSYFNIDSIESAQFYFSKIMISGSKYASTSRYYYAHTNFKKGLYNSALHSFQKLLKDENFISIVPYYITQIYFFQKNYKKLIVFAKPFLKEVNLSRRAELNRLLAEAYFQLNDFSNAIVHFELFLKDKKENNLFEHLLLGYSYFQVSNYENAISNLEKITYANDSILQYSSYYLAISYLKQENFNYALQAFKKAASFDFNIEIREDAFYNYAKLSYQLDLPFENTFDVLSTYLKEFDNSNNKKEIEFLMVKILQSSSKYFEAYSSLIEINSPSYEQKKALQQTAYFLAIKEFNQKNFKNAVSYFNVVIKYPISETYLLLANFWISDCYYHLNEFEKAIEGFSQLSLGEDLSDYDDLRKYKLAYAYFKNLNYVRAVKWFRSFEKVANDSIKINDTYLRIADSYFMNSDFVLSEKYYKKAIDINVFDVDYASYQYAISLGLVGKKQQKLKVLKEIIKSFKNSSYYDNSLYHLAKYYKNNSNYDDANMYYDDLISVSADNDLIADAYLSKGIIYLNTNKAQLAIDQFSFVINEFQNTIYFKEALSGLQSAYTSLAEIEKYLSIIEQLPEISISRSEQDSLTYNTAFIKFSELDYKVAKNSFEKYIKTFESGLFLNDALYYNAISSLVLGDTASAVFNYQKLTQSSSNLHKEDAFIFLARRSYSLRDFKNSNNYYIELEDLASSNSVKREVIIRLMNGNEFLNSKIALVYANKVTTLSKVDDWLLSKALVIIARNEFQSGNYAKSKLTFEKVSSLSDYDEGAEAKYFLAYLEYLDENLVLSERIIFELSDNYSNDFFIAKAFILLSDIYVLKNNLFQAKATLESIIENHKNEEIINLSRKKWEVIIEREHANKKKKNINQTFIEISEDIFDYEIEEIEEFDDTYIVKISDTLKSIIDTNITLNKKSFEDELE